MGGRAAGRNLTSTPTAPPGEARRPETSRLDDVPALLTGRASVGAGPHSPARRPARDRAAEPMPAREQMLGSRDMSDYPFRVGVMQLTMEPLDEMLASARVMDEAGMDTVWLAEAYPVVAKHQMEARSSTVVSALMARETNRLHDRLGDHLAVDAPPGAGGDGRAGRPGGRRTGTFLLGSRDLEDLPQQHQGPDQEDARPMRDAVDDRAGRPLGRGFHLRRERGAPT